MKVNILGTEYSIQKKGKNEDEYLKDWDGYCDRTSKTIVVRKKDGEDNADNFEEYQKVLIRHEIIHAFLFESGLAQNWIHVENGHEETMVDWIAIQFPKLLEAFRSVNVL